MTPNPPRRAVEPTPNAGGESHVRPEWVEAAARALATLAGGADAYDRLNGLYHDFWRARAVAALAAALPAIQAQALRDAAASLDKYAAADVDLLMGTVMRSLRARADRIERGELP